MTPKSENLGFWHPQKVKKVIKSISGTPKKWKNTIRPQISQISAANPDLTLLFDQSRSAANLEIAFLDPSKVSLWPGTLKKWFHDPKKW